MVNNIDGKYQAKPVAWLYRLIRTITCTEYEHIGRLQAAICNATDNTNHGNIEATIFKRREAIKLWHRLVPFCVLFLPLWFVCVAALHNGPTSVVQVAALVFTIGISSLSYLLTFHRDSVRYQSNLAQVRQNLLLILHKETVSSALKEINELKIPIPKGCIPMFLLNELVKKEAGMSSIFSASVDEVMPFCKMMIGFDEKNFKKVMPQYRRRNDIILDTENARTTHIKYLDIIIRHYQAIGDEKLEQAGITLQNFLNRIPLKDAG